ncbi:MAG: fatty acid desaturase [Bacteroidota bacterium]
MEQVIKKWTNHPQTGVRIGITVIVLWAVTLIYNVSTPINWYSPLTYLMVFVQAHLFTGLFITAHDAMHGAVAPKNHTLNNAIGRIASFLFVFNSYDKLKPKHYDHHKHAGTEHDPDFHNGNPNFFRWYFDFLKEYISWKQILLAALFHNFCKFVLGAHEINMVVFWIIPSIMGTFQLFYFGTFIPHMGEHQNKHNARSQGKNHLWAFLSCYFFGYHFEHHDSPRTPWWKLWELK